MHFLLTSGLWGQLYAKNFLDLCLPCYLAEGNIPAVSKKHTLTYLFYCDDAARNEFARSPLMEKLQEYAKAEIHTIPPNWFSETDQHVIMNQCHQCSIDKAFDMNAPIIFAQPDMIIGPDTLGNAVKHIEMGKRMVYVGCLSANIEVIRKEFPNLLNADGILNEKNGGRIFAKKFLPHLCTWNRIYFHDSPVTSDLPIQMTFQKDASNLLTHYISGAYGLIAYPTQKAQSRYALDCLFPYEACPDTSKIHMVQDSDECAVIEFAPLNKTPVTLQMLPAHEKQIAYYVLNNCTPHELFVLKKPFIFHDGPLDENWNETTSLSKHFLESLQSTLTLPRKELMEWCKHNKYHISHFPWADEDRKRAGLPTQEEIIRGELIPALPTSSTPDGSPIHTDLTAENPTCSLDVPLQQPPSFQKTTSKKNSGLVKIWNHILWLINWPKKTHRLLRDLHSILHSIQHETLVTHHSLKDIADIQYRQQQTIKNIDANLQNLKSNPEGKS